MTEAAGLNPVVGKISNVTMGSVTGIISSPSDGSNAGSVI